MKPAIELLEKLGKECQVSENLSTLISGGDLVLLGTFLELQDQRIKELEENNRMISRCHHNNIITVQSAYIAGLAENPEKAMVWLHNYLDGPGLLPTNEEMAGGAQVYSDKYSKF